MGSTKEEQERVKNLLLDTVTLLCKNGLNFKQQMKVQGLLGITLDDDSVFIVHIDEKIGDIDAGKKEKEKAADQGSKHSQAVRKKRKHSSDSNSMFSGTPEKVFVKMEKEEPDDLVLLDSPADDKSLIKAQIYQQQQQLKQQQAGFMPTSNEQSLYHLENTALPGIPYLDASQPSALPPTSLTGSSDQQSQFLAACFWKGRRSVPHQEKKYVCSHQGCGLAYNLKCNLLRHQNQKHGRPIVKRARYPYSYNSMQSEMQDNNSRDENDIAQKSSTDSAKCKNPDDSVTSSIIENPDDSIRSSIIENSDDSVRSSIIENPDDSFRSSIL